MTQFFLLQASDGLVLDGRKLLCSLAVSRDKIQKIASEKKANEKVDNRNLHLIREGRECMNCSCFITSLWECVANDWFLVVLMKKTLKMFLSWPTK